MRACRHIEVDRADGESSLAVAERYLVDGELVGIFPEATISRAMEIKDLKTGAVRIAPDLDRQINADDLRPIIADLLDDDSSRAAFARAMIGERTLVWQYARSFADGKTYLAHWREPDLEGKFFAYLYRPITLNDAPIAMRHASHIATAAASSDFPEFIRRAPSLDEPQEVHDAQWLHPIAKALCWSPEARYRPLFPAPSQNG